MSVRTAESVWNGTLKEGNGTMKVESGAFSVPFSFSTRFEEEPGTNPEELIGAALSGCFSMFLSAVLTGDDFPPNSVQTEAKVHLETVDGAPWVTKIALTCEADVPNIDEAKFQEHVANSKQNCPISKALAGVKEITVTAALVS